ncbi:MAG: aldehyde dehydrogenase family protein, partial [Hymenobacter sp.]
MKQALEEATTPDVTVPHPHADPHGMRDVLHRLGVKPENPATCTGRTWGGAAGAQKVIVSPADGQRIAAVAVA